jgi:hypothetical protein
MVASGANRPKVARWLVWLAVSLCAFIAWQLLDMPAGASEPVEAKVLRSYSSFARLGYADIKTVLLMPDGTQLTYSSARMHESGASVLCARQRRRLSGFFVYRC